MQGLFLCLLKTDCRRSVNAGLALRPCEQGARHQLGCAEGSGCPAGWTPTPTFYAYARAWDINVFAMTSPKRTGTALPISRPIRLNLMSAPCGANW